MEEGPISPPLFYTLTPKWATPQTKRRFRAPQDGPRPPALRARRNRGRSQPSGSRRPATRLPPSLPPSSEPRVDSRARAARPVVDGPGNSAGLLSRAAPGASGRASAGSGARLGADKAVPGGGAGSPGRPSAILGLPLSPPPPLVARPERHLYPSDSGPSPLGPGSLRAAPGARTGVVAPSLPPVFTKQ